MHLLYRPKIEKIVELLLYMAHVRPGADKYQAVKFFYLADREHINRYGRPITQEVYYALTYGPVASTVKDIMEKDRRPLAKIGIEELPFELIDRGKYTYIEAPHREVNLALFSKSDLKVFDKIIAEYGKCNFDQLFQITHKHKAYKKAWGRKKPSTNRELMYYDEMIESSDRRQAMLDDFVGVSQYLE